MIVRALKSKIHRAVVTDANINYIGSISIDKNLLYKNINKVPWKELNNMKFQSSDFIKSKDYSKYLI